MIPSSVPGHLLREVWTLKTRVLCSNPHFETEDARKDYGERRIICYGMLGDRMVVVGYTPRGADHHVFSMRKANDREKALIAPLLEI